MSSEHALSEPDLPLVHQRQYDIKAYRYAKDIVQLRGVMIDDKPAGLHFINDDRNLRIHQIGLDLLVELPSMKILRAKSIFDYHPHDQCPQISTDYESLVGLSIARGFTQAVKERFGGPRGCTHVNALLNAMAPTIIQTTWSMRLLDRAEDPASFADGARDHESPAANWQRTIGTCHVWAPDGELVQQLEAGAELQAPMPYRTRAVELKVRPRDWSSLPE